VYLYGLPWSSMYFHITFPSIIRGLFIGLNGPAQRTNNITCQAGYCVNKYAHVSRLIPETCSFNARGVFGLSIFEWIVLKVGEFDMN
jgi:hypothetical protein